MNILDRGLSYVREVVSFLVAQLNYVWVRIGGFEKIMVSLMAVALSVRLFIVPVIGGQLSIGAGSETSSMRKARRQARRMSRKQKKLGSGKNS